MTDYYVNKDAAGASNSNPGTWASPWLTVPYAIGTTTPATAGDTIWVVKAATPYTGNYSFGKSGTVGNRITLRSYDPYDPAVLQPTAGTTIGLQRNNWNIYDLVFTGATQTCLQGGNSGTLSQNITIDNCVFKHNESTALAMRNTDGWIVQNTLFYDNRTRIAGDGCFDIYSNQRATNFIIRKCRFHDHSADGIQFDAGSGLSGIIEDCVFGILRPFSTSSRYWQDGGNAGENGIDLKRVGGPLTIRRCIFIGYYNTIAGQDASGGNGNAFVIHNTCSDVTFEDCYIYDCAQGPSVSQGGNSTGNNSNITWRQIVARDFNPANGASNYGMITTYVSNLIIENITIRGASYYWVFGPSVDIDYVYNMLITGGGGAATGTYDRNATNVTGETNIRRCAFHNVAGGPPSQWNNDPVTITTLGLNSHQAPGASSSALNAGYNNGLTRDLAGVIRPVTPAIGAFEQMPANPTSCNLLYCDGRTKYLPGYFEETADDDGEIIPYPVAGESGIFGLAIKINDTSAHSYRSVFSSTGTLRFAFYIQPYRFQMTSGDSFSVVTIRDNSNRLGDVILRYSSGTFYIGANVQNDAGTAQWVGSSSGFAITRGVHLVEVQIVKATTAGANNGTIQLWIDGVSQGSVTNIDNDTIGMTRLHWGAPADIDAGTGDDEEELGTFYIYGMRANNNGQTIGPLDTDLPDLPVVYDDDSRIKAYYQFTEASGTRQDLTINNNDLTDATSVGRVAEGVDGYSADFERDDGDQLSIAHASVTGLHITNDKVTLIARVKPESVGVFQYIVAKWGPNTNRMQYALVVNASNLLQMRVSTNGSAGVDAESKAAVAAGVWVWLAGTYGGTTLLAYVNGARSGLPVLQSGNLYNGNADVMVGGHSDGGSRFDGLQDYLIIGAGEFSAAEMEYIYTYGLAAASPAAAGIAAQILFAPGPLMISGR